MKLVRKVGKIEIWVARESYGEEFYVFGVTDGGDAIVCPSYGMACEMAGI